MQLDKASYSELINKILNLFCDIFGADMLFVKKQEELDHMGYFKIQYRYLPSEYDIIFENERNVFCIDIYDRERAKNSLYRIEKFENKTEIKNIENAIQKLKNVLKQDDFCVYITREGKLYRKKIINTKE